MRKIVVIGGGFSGIAAARTLKKRLAGMKRVEITLVSDRAHFLASPHLPKVATGDENVGQITTHLSKLIEAPVRLEIDRVLDISPEEKIIHTEKSDLPYDFAIVAAGTMIDWRGLDPSQSNVIGCKTASDFLNIHDRMKSSLRTASTLVDDLEKNAEQLEKLCTFVVVGAGPTGITLASKLQVALNEKYAPEYPKLRTLMKVLLVDADDRVLTEFPELSSPVRDELHKIGVKLSLKTKVVEFGKGEVVVEQGQSIPAENVFWCGGVKRYDFFNQPEMERLGDASLRHLQHREIYVVGDCVDNVPSTMNAHCAVAQGQLAASNIVADLAGRKSTRWSNRQWPVILDLGNNTIALNARGDVLKGRTARVYAKTARAKLLSEWMGGGLDTWKMLISDALKKTSTTLFLDE